MKCETCGGELFIVLSTEPSSEANSTAVYDTVSFACPNPKCDNYGYKKSKQNPKITKVWKRPRNQAAREEVKASGTA